MRDEARMARQTLRPGVGNFDCITLHFEKHLQHLGGFAIIIHDQHALLFRRLLYYLWTISAPGRHCCWSPVKFTETVGRLHILTKNS
jgi:hypothetical protein